MLNWWKRIFGLWLRKIKNDFLKGRGAYFSLGALQDQDPPIC